jgi:hypothetical protein
MIIPNKSTFAEEDIEVPYGREYKTATMHCKIAGLERNLGREGESEQKRVEGGEGVRAMGELVGSRKVSVESCFVSAMLVLCAYSEHDDLRQDKERDN